jgi:hypothetical protein
MANGRTFIAQLQSFAQRFPEKMDAIARQTCQQVSENVITSTPVDTGFLRSSWQPSIGKPQAGNGGEGMQGQAAAKISFTVAQMKAGEVYYLTNNAIYAKRIEFGFVGKDALGRNFNQQGRFMVTDNVKRWPMVVESVVKDLGLK